MQFLTPPEGAEFESAMRHCLRGETPARLGIALSGGGDSTALALLLADWAKAQGIALFAVTVNHGLREEAGAEAAAAADFCRARGIEHRTVAWRGWDGGGNLQAAARAARQRLIGEWAAGLGIDTVALGHTADDQAETVVARLMRGSGVDGLSAMAPVTRRAGLIWIRPLLKMRRRDLRDLLKRRDIRWCDDPSNEDGRFDRVRIRRALAQLQDLGLEVPKLAATAENMQRARAALECETHDLAREIAIVTAAGSVEIALEGLQAASAEIRLRLLAHALRWVASADYRPRLRPLEAVLAKLSAPGRDTLSGCLLTHARDGLLRIGREPAAVAETIAGTGALWDNRWRAEGPGGDGGLQVRALGEAGLAACPDWRASGLARDCLLAAPAIWRGDELVAAPLAGRENGWRLRLDPGPDHFFASVLSH